MNEDYLERLHSKIEQGKAEVSRLNGYKSSLSKEINELRDLRDKSRRSVDNFVTDQIKYSNDKIKESRDFMDKEIKDNKKTIISINRMAQQIVDDEAKIKIEKLEIESLETSLTEKGLSLAKREKESGDIAEALEAAKTALKYDKLASDDRKEKVCVLLEKAEEKMLLVEIYEKERRGVIEKKEKILNKEYALTKVKQELMDDGMKWVNDQKVKIQDQWNKLLLAKQSLDERSG